MNVDILLGIGAVIVAVVFIAQFTRDNGTRALQRRVIWRESDARARLRVADKWAPTESHEGPWDIKGDNY